MEEEVIGVSDVATAMDTQSDTEVRLTTLVKTVNAVTVVTAGASNAHAYSYQQ